MAFQYLEADNLFDAFNDSKKYMRPLFEPLQEFERVARNRPHPGIDKAYPKVTDGTTAGVIQKTPRRIIQQLPTGIAHSDTNDWLTHVASFIFSNRIVPNANMQYALIQKCWNAVSKALTYGSQPGYVPFINRGKYFGTDLLLPYIKDVFLEPGKLSDDDSNFILMRAWYQPRDIKAIIANQSKLKDKGVDGGWDLTALAEIEDDISQKDDFAVTPNERDKNNRTGGVEIIHAFQRGIGGKFYSFHMGKKKLVRTKTNPDPRGAIPIHYLYADTDGSNPLGRGWVELCGAMQNLMDSEVQMYQYNRALMLNPPMIKKGDWNENQAKFAPNVLVDLGSNPNVAYEPLKIDSTAIQSFPQNYGLMKSQLLNLLSSPNPNVSAQSGDPTMSKTQAGVKGAAAVVDVDDNYIRKQFETWYEKIAETQVNLYFAEHHGVQPLQLDSETAAKIRELNPDLVSPDDEINIDFDSDTEELQFFVDPGTTDKKDDADEIAKLQEVIQTIEGNPYALQYMQQTGKDLNFGEVYRQMFEKIGLKDMDKIIVDLPKDENGVPQAPPPMAMDRPKLSAHFESLPPAAQVQFLRNAGINVTLQDVAQAPVVDPNVRGQAGGAGTLTGDSALAAQDPTLLTHPTLAAMAALKIPFDALPEDSKGQVLQLIGLPSTQLSPKQQGLEMDAIKHSHDILNGMQPQPPQMPPGMAGNQTPAQPAAQPQQPDPQAAQAEQQQFNNQPGLTQAPPQPPSPGAMPFDQISPADQQYIEELRKMGVPEALIGQALAMLNHGVPAEDVLNAIQGALSNGR